MNCKDVNKNLDDNQFYIYKITNIINNKIYIGQTIHSIEERFRGHVYASEKSDSSNVLLQNAIKKYGKDSFKIEIIEVCTTREQLDLREKCWINYYNSRNKDIGYNMAPGGEGGCGGPMFTGHKHSSETKLKMSLDRQGSKNANYGNRWKRTSDMKYPSLEGEHNPMFGKTQTESSKEQNRQKHLGKLAYSNFQLDKVKMLTKEEGEALIASDSNWFEGNIHAKNFKKHI